VELRCISTDGKGRIASGFYRDPAKLVQDAVEFNTTGLWNVYVTLNVIGRNADALYQSAPDGLYTGVPQATRNQNITHRLRLLIDVDTTSSEKGCCSTDQEKAAARTTAERVQEYLTAQGWPEPILADSGNAYHLIYSLGGAPESPELKLAYKQFLKVLNQRFENDQAKIDQTVCRACQITKLYGSAVFKGPSTPGRPHRCSRLEHVPDQLVPVTLYQIQAIAGELQQRRPSQPSIDQDYGCPWNIDELLAQHNIEAIKDTGYATDSGETATRWVLPKCIWNAEHQDRSCWIVQWQNGAVASGCHHDGCAGKGWIDFKRALGIPVDPVPQLTFSNAQDRPVDTVEAPGPDNRPVLADVAYNGLLGDIARSVAPYTEADPAAILGHSLAMAGHVIGRRAFVPLSDSRHFPKLYVAVVGRTSAGRKGTALDTALRVFERAVPDYQQLIHSGLSTGEGLIKRVCDPVIRSGADGELKVVEEGARDKRALFIEAELSIILQRFRREGNTLSQIIRDGWDNKPLAVTTKTNPLRSTDSHIVIVGHCTPIELMENLRPADIHSGLGNRFLWMFVNRSQYLPEAPPTPDHVLDPLAQQLQTVLNVPERTQSVGLTPAALEYWRTEYHRLSQLAEEADPQIEGLLSRAPAQTRRLALIYAITANAVEVDVDHLKAALAIVEFSRQTVEYLFREYKPSGTVKMIAADPKTVAARILEGLGYGPMSRTDMTNMFHRNRSSEEIDAALALLRADGKILEETEATKGRPITRYRLAD
jgi:hypothetical protein